jgi:DNA repair protein RadD
MDATNLEQLKTEKNLLLLRLETAKKSGDRRSMFNLGSEAAALEGYLARLYLLRGDSQRAVINLISQASCLCDSNRLTEASRIYRKAAEIASIPQTQAWIQDAVKNLPPAQAPGDSFVAATPFIEGNKKLRRPQVEAYEATHNHFTSKKGHVIVQLPVGCGKTGTMALVPFGTSAGRVLAIAPNLEIRKTLYDNLNYHNSETSFLKRFGVLSNGKGPSCAFLDSDANIHDCDSADIVVTNIQQLAGGSASRWLKKLAPDFFDMILIDEAHHNVASTWQTTLEQFPDAKIVSFTATPLRADGQKVQGERIYRFPIIDAITEGYIKDIASRCLEPQELCFTYKDENRKATLEEVLQLRENAWFSKGVALSRECNESIVDASIQAMTELRESGEKHQIIAVACSIDHARSIRSLYEERNLKADIIHSDMEEEEQEGVRGKLKERLTDVVVQVQMLGEGADYPHLSVAAIFRPFRHLMPYVQFVGRIMRVIVPDAPGDRRNRGYVISHVGLNVDRWWKELRIFDKDDEKFFSEVASGDHDFMLEQRGDDAPVPKRKRFKPDMTVLEETITHFVQERFLEEDARLVVDDLVEAINLRGIDFESLGLSRQDLEQKLKDAEKSLRERGPLHKMAVSPQQARKAARQRLNERVRSAAKQLLNDLDMRPVGRELPMLYPGTGAGANLPAAIILLNRAVSSYLGAGPEERDILTAEQMKRAHDNMDEIIDGLVKEIRKKRG